MHHYLKIMIIFVFGFIIHSLSDQKLLPAGMMTGAEMTEMEAILNLPEFVCKKYASHTTPESFVALWHIY